MQQNSVVDFLMQTNNVTRLSHITFIAAIVAACKQFHHSRSYYFQIFEHSFLYNFLAFISTWFYFHIVHTNGILSGQLQCIVRVNFECRFNSCSSASFYFVDFICIVCIIFLLQYITLAFTCSVLLFTRAYHLNG